MLNLITTNITGELRKHVNFIGLTAIPSSIAQTLTGKAAINLLHKKPLPVRVQLEKTTQQTLTGLAIRKQQLKL